MGVKKKRFKNEEFEVLEHDETPGYRTAFHIIICVAVFYFIYMFSHIAH